MDELKNICPIHSATSPDFVKCLGQACAWWCGYSEECAVVTAADILMDSTISRSVAVRRPSHE